MNDKIYTLDKKFIAEQNDKGIWIFKADESVLFKQDTKTLKKKYHDLPRYKIVVEYEKEFKDDTDKFLKDLILAMVKKLKDISK